MFQVEIGSTSVNAEVSFYTGWLYESEFGSSLIADLYGRHDMDDAGFVDTEVVENSDGGGFELKVKAMDFSKVPWDKIVKALWAAIKTADESTLPFQAWSKSMNGVDLLEIRGALYEAVDDCFFRPRTPEEDE